MNASLSLLDVDNLPLELRNLLNSPDGPAFEQALDVLVHEREKKLFRSLGQMARELHGAMQRLGEELTHDGVPGRVADVRQHLDDVLEMSAQAAHRSIDFAERMRPAAQALAYNASEVLAFHDSADDPASVLAHEASDFALSCCDGLTDMVTGQSWQDLSGQRIKKVASFIDSVEASLLELVRLTGALSEAPVCVVKVATQDDADRLLSEFGF